MAHMPGPWILEPDSIGQMYYLVPESGGMTGEKEWGPWIASIHRRMGDKPIPNAEGNAHLIAAAPDLLDALKALMPEGWGEDDTMDHIPGVKLARLAIAKAEGGK
jgi:hypothetical protein